MKDKHFAVMRWLNDGNRLSVHSLTQIVDPKLPLTEYKMGMCGEALYTGYKGLWQFRILAVGDKTEMIKWLNSRLQYLLFDVSDKFCEESEPEKTPKKGQSESEETPKKGQSEPEKTPKKGQSEPKKTLKKGQSEPEKTPKKGQSEREKTPKRGQSEPKKTLKKGQSEPEKTLKKGQSEPKKGQSEPEKTPKKGQSEREKTPKRGQSEPKKTLKKGQSEPEKTLKKGQSEPKKGQSEPEKTPKKRQSEPEKTPKKRRLELFGVETVPQKSSKSGEIEDSENWKTPEKKQLDLLPRRSPRNLEKLEGSDSIKYLSRDGGRKDPSGERIKKLEEEVKSLRKKARKLEDRVKILDDAVLKPSAVHSPEAKPYCSVQSPAAKTSGPSPEVKSTRNPSTPNSIKSSGECPEVFASGERSDVKCSTINPSEEQIAKDVCSITGDQDIFKYLCNKVFSREELVSNTRTGKKTIKCMDDAKPQFNATKFQFLEKMVITHTAFDKNTFYKKTGKSAESSAQAA